LAARKSLFFWDRAGRASTLHKCAITPSAAFIDRERTAMASTEEIETTTRFSPRFDEHGLVTCVVVDAGDGSVLMLAHMNAEALDRTIETREAWFWSRSRKTLWRKGETSGNTLQVEELLVDCDQDALLLRARVGGKGVVCHTGRRSCFYRQVPLGAGNKNAALAFLQAR
jgi:phosphoribosyl-AMP cyclohydrolase